MKNEMRDLWKEIDKNIARYGEIADEEVQKVIERHRSTRSREKDLG